VFWVGKCHQEKNKASEGIGVGKMFTKAKKKMPPHLASHLQFYITNAYIKCERITNPPEQSASLPLQKGEGSGVNSG
jgi:hypothetical protein